MDANTPKAVVHIVCERRATRVAGHFLHSKEPLHVMIGGQEQGQQALLLPQGARVVCVVKARHSHFLQAALLSVPVCIPALERIPRPVRI